VYKNVLQLGTPKLQYCLQSDTTATKYDPPQFSVNYHFTE